jgi:hypothetical protein
MEWEPIVAVLIFIAGLAWNRHDGDRRERRASRAAAAATFEQLQRETHLEVQDILTNMYRLAVRASLSTAATETEEFHSVAQRASALASRLADSEVRKLVGEVVVKCHAMADSDSEDELDAASDPASDALAEALAQLGALVRKPPLSV